MSEYIPKYPSEEGDDSNKTSSELLAETLKPIYVPQELMLAWESHLASYSRDTHVLLDQVKESEDALNAQYQALLARVQKYEQMLQDITMDSNEFTMDTDEVNFTGWNILAQASYWDYLLRKEITKLSDQIKSTEYKGGLISEVTDAVLEGLIADNTYISNVIGALSDTPLIRELDAALTSTVTSISDLQAEYVRLAEKQVADAAALADQQVLNVEQLVADINTSKAEQLNRLAEEAAVRTQLLQELEAKTDAITADYNAVVDTLHTTVIQELTTMQDGISASVSELKTADEAIITSLDAYKVSNGQNIAALQNSVNVITNTQESIATQVTGLIASYDQLDLGLSRAQADIVTSNQARADGDAALSQQITTINTGLGDANSRIDTVSDSVSTLDSATATKFSALNAELIDVNTSVASARQIADSAVTANTAQASEINMLNARMSTTESNVTNKADATALSNLETKVDNADAALSIRIDSLVANLTTPDGTEIDANAFNALRAEVISNSDNITTHTSQINALNSSLSNVNTGLTANAAAVSDLTTTVTQQGESITSHSQAIRQLQSDLDVAEAGLATKASTTALNTTNTNVSSVDGRVTTTNSNVTALTGRVSTVEGAVATKAEASALNSLTTRVATEEGKSTSQGSAITSLQNTINHATTGLSTKASSAALTAVDNKVTAANGRIDTTNSNVATLTGRVSTVEGAVSTKAEASALTALTTRVSNAEGVNTSQGSAITTLENSVNHGTTGLATRAATSALTATNSEVSRINGVVSGHATQLSNLTASIAGKADTSALNSLTARVEAEEGKSSSQASSITSLNSSITAINDTITIQDTRNTNEPPSWYWANYPQKRIVEFKFTSVIGVSGLFEGTYCNLETVVHWADSSGGHIIQTATSDVDPSLYVQRKSISTSAWGAWSQPIKDLRDSLEAKASASAVSTLDTKVTSIDGRVTSQASQITTLTSDNAANKNALQIQATVIDGVKANYMVKMETNGVIGGFGLMQSTGALGQVQTTFGVNADSFFIGAPAGGKKPFIVTTTSQQVDGITYPAGTWINSAIIADATIGSAHINDASITNAKIKDAAITDAKIVSLSASKISVPTSDPFPSKVTANDVTVTSNKSISGNVAALFDGAFATGSAYVTFEDAKGDNSEDAYLQVDLKNVRKISQAVLWFYAGDGRTYEYKIKYSNDGTNWKYLEGSPTVWIKSAQPTANNAGTYINTATPTQVYLGSLFECRYLRIYGNGNTVNSGNHLYELEIASQSFNTVIDGSGILTNAVTADKIQVNSLSAISANLGAIQVGSANIADAAITNAKIDNLAITSAKIGNLQVDTIKIKDDAVSIGVGGQGVHTLSTVSNGGKIRLDVGVQAFDTQQNNNKWYLRVLRNGTSVRVFVFEGIEGKIENENHTPYTCNTVCVLPPIIETIPAGTTVTYSVQIAIAAGTSYSAPNNTNQSWLRLSNLSMAITELKK